MKASYKKRYKSLLNSLNAGIVVHDTETRVKDYNQRAEEILGLNLELFKEESTAEYSWYFVDEEEKPLQKDLYPVNQILQTGCTIKDQVMGIKHKNNQVDWFKVNGLPIKDNQDEIYEVLISFIDISDEKRAIQRSKDKERAYQNLYQTMSQGVIYHDGDGHIISANPSAERILSMDSKHLKGMAPGDPKWLMIDEHGEQVHGENHPAMLALNRGKKVGPVTIGFFVPDKENYVWLKITAIPQYDEDGGKPWGVFTTFDDITEKRQKDVELLKLSTAVEQSPVSVVITDTSGHIEYVNPKFESLTGYALEDVQGKNPSVLNSGEQPPEFYKEMWSTILSGKTWRGEFKNRKKNGDLYWESANISPIRNDKGVTSHFLAVKEDITQLKNQEIRLKESEKRFREIFETLPEISVQGYNADREVIYWNKASEWLYGFTKEEALGQKLEDLIIPEAMNKEVVKNIKDAVTQNLAIPSSELVLQHADGTPVPVYSNHTMLVNHFGEKELYCVDIDLRELKEKETKLRKTEERYRSIIEVSNIGAWEYDIEKDDLWLSTENFTMLGYDKDEIDYAPEDGLKIWEDNLHPDDYERAMRKFELYKKSDLSGTLEDQFRLMHKDGSSVWVLLRGQALTNPDGTPSSTILGTHIDITDRKQYEEKIKDSELYHRSLIKTIPDLIFVLDKDGRFLDYNSTEEDLYITDEGFLGRRIDEIFPDEIASSHQQATERAFEENNPVEFQYSLFENGSKREFSSKVAAFGQDKVITVVRDISERINNIKKLENLLHIKEQQNKKLNNFTHIVSHNLRTHSANMKGLLSLLEMEKPDLAEDQYMKMVSESVNYLGETIENLNQVLKIHNAEFDSLPVIDVHPHLNKVINALSHSANEVNVEFINEVPEHAKVRALPTYIDSIIQNMLTNAIKYRSEDRQSFVKIGWEKDESFTTLTFKDNGLGIDLDLYGSKIFGMYQTFHKNNDSVGLGLFITKTQIEEMGGTIQVTSSVDNGTTFKIRLPNGKN